MIASLGAAGNIRNRALQIRLQFTFAVCMGLSGDKVEFVRDTLSLHGNIDGFGCAKIAVISKVIGNTNTGNLNLRSFLASTLPLGCISIRLDGN